MSESQIVANDREETRSLRDAEDTGGIRRVGGIRYYAEDLPTPDEL